MDKVKITQEQAEAIKHFKKVYPEKFKGMRYQEFYDALINGYEIEPVFKVNDWVVCEAENIIGQVKYSYNNGMAIKLFGYCSDFDKCALRHATPEEIEQEIEIRKWDKYNRGVWDLKEGDVMIRNNDAEIKIIELLDHDYKFEHIKETILLVGGGDHLTGFKEIKNEWKVFIFRDQYREVNQ